MSGDTADRAPVELPPLHQRWPTGVTTLIGLAAGALAGLLIGIVPLGIAAGAAVGVGIDSLANRLLNDETGV
jgi:uncharacterized membrane protein